MNEFHYRFAGPARSQRPGHHRGNIFGAGQEFSRYVPLLSAPDMRRIDIRATLSDPSGAWQARVFQQRASIPVVLVADVSRSMSFHAAHTKLAVLADFAASLAYSVRRTGDAFGLIACDEDVVPELLLLPTHAHAAGEEFCARLAGFEPVGASSKGLLRARGYLGRRQALVFLASDYHFPLGLLDEVLESLAAHAVVPMVMWDSMGSDGEFERIPRLGLMRLEDAEAGEHRTILLRTVLRNQWQRRMVERRRALLECFIRHGRQPFFVGPKFSSQSLTAYFLGG